MCMADLAHHSASINAATRGSACACMCTVGRSLFGALCAWIYKHAATRAFTYMLCILHPASCMQCCLTGYACPRPPARTNHAPALRALSTTCQALNARKDRAHFEDLVSDLTGSLSHAQSKLEDARVEMQMAEKRHEELLVKQVSRPPSLDSPCLLPPPTPSYPHDPWSTLHHLL